MSLLHVRFRGRRRNYGIVRFAWQAQHPTRTCCRFGKKARGNARDVKLRAGAQAGFLAARGRARVYSISACFLTAFVGFLMLLSCLVTTLPSRYLRPQSRGANSLDGLAKPLGIEISTLVEGLPRARLREVEVPRLDGLALAFLPPWFLAAKGPKVVWGGGPAAAWGASFAHAIRPVWHAELGSLG